MEEDVKWLDYAAYKEELRIHEEMEKAWFRYMFYGIDTEGFSDEPIIEEDDERFK